MAIPSRIWGISLVASTLLAFATPTLAQSTDPLQVCTPTQARAAERYWYAGNKIAIDFGTTGTSHTITANASTAANAGEGSTVVTDSNGTLQFWVGGGTIHNRDQVPMANGTGLLGNLSAVQVVTAFAAPGVPGRYFVVATSGSNGAVGNLYYSIIDMTANGGLGEVTATKNVLLASSLAGEALSAAPTSDGLGYWVLTTQYGSSNLVAIRFDDDGPVGSPVLTALSRPLGSVYGTIYFNPQLNRMAVLNGGTNGNSYVHLMQFNASTGAATELASWQVPTGGLSDPNIGGSGARTAYAADFTASGNYLYVSQIYPGRLWRYDVTSEVSATIAASQEFVGLTGSGSQGGGHVRRGPDGAIWVANLDTSSTLTRIAEPDAALTDIGGAGIGFVRGNVALPAGATSTWGLPQLVAGCARAMEPDAVPSIAAPAAPFNAGTVQNVTVTLANEGTLGDVEDGLATITLPPNVRLVGALPTGCTAATVAATDPQVITCDLSNAALGPLAPGASVPVAFQISVSTPGTYAIDVAISAVTDEVNVTNNTASTTVTVIAAPIDPALPVPALSQSLLAMMGLLLAGVGFMQRRKR